MSRPPLTGLLLVVGLLVAFGLVATIDRPDPSGADAWSIDSETPTPTPTPRGSVDIADENFPLPINVAVAALALAAVALLARELLVPWLAARNRSSEEFEGDAAEGGGADPEEGSGDDEEDENGDATLGAVGAAAGTAADRIEADAGFTNEVYRSYHEMTRLLELDPETTAPDEFADHAVAAGMAPDHVEELTRLFEEVRYGERAPGSREERAVAALRRIEAAYAPDDAVTDEDETGAEDGTDGTSEGDDR